MGKKLGEIKFSDINVGTPLVNLYGVKADVVFKKTSSRHNYVIIEDANGEVSVEWGSKDREYINSRWSFDSQRG